MGRIQTMSGARALPVCFTRFFGRADEIREIERLLAEAPLLTLLGAPGCGKSRLGLEVSKRVFGRYAEGVQFVELAGVSGPDQVADAVAVAVGVTEEPGRSAGDTLIDALAKADLLIVLDNCEHVVDGAADLARRLVASCPSVRFMATSRVALGVPGEQVFAVPPLGIGAAVDMFTHRAGLASGRAQTDAADRADAAGICQRLGQLPLAVELTAAWTRVLAPGQIVDRLDDPRVLLRSEARGVAPRQATMEATIDWSYQLLKPGEQRLFDRLSVFVGGFDLEAAEAVAATDNDDVLSELTGLVEHSLVLARPSADEPMRYRLLGPLRQFGSARLASRGESETTRGRHAAHYLVVARRADLELSGDGRAFALRRLDREEANLHAALDWARSERSELGPQLCVALSPYWELRGRVNDGRAWLDRALQVDITDGHLHGAVLARAGRLAWRQNDHEQARALLEASLAIERESGDGSSVARRLRSLALVAMSDGDTSTAQVLAEQSLSRFRERGDQQGEVWALVFVAWAHYAGGDMPAGADHMRQALETNRSVGVGAVTVNALLGLAYDAAIAEHVTAHRALLADALSGLENVGGDLEEIVWLWLGASLAANQNRFAAALRLAGRAEAQSRRHGGRNNERFMVPLEPLLERARRSAGPAVVERLHAEGAQMTWDELTAEALAPSDGDAADPLSPREREVAALVARGLTNVEIAEQLFISKRTVESHIDHIKRKLGLSTRQQVIARELRAALAPQP